MPLKQSTLDRFFNINYFYFYDFYIVDRLIRIKGYRKVGEIIIFTFSFFLLSVSGGRGRTGREATPSLFNASALLDEG